ncbi:MAG: sulfatase-like hydrolase/transferase [Phycisphaera sp.]|nr:sulfatase-like hydrolase/transferase [Phycisphaera sp.]
MHRTLTLLLAAITLAVTALAHAADRPNVLFICVDDLRPQLGCYGETYMHTPHLDKLASQARLFNKHYVQVPTCGASRYSMMTGQYPRSGAAYGNGAFSLMRGKDATTPESMPHLFKLSGYRTVSIGKVSHSPDGYVYGYNKPRSDVTEMPNSWDDRRMPLGKWIHGWAAFFAYADGTGRNERLADHQPIPVAEAADVPDTGYPDGLIAEDAIGQLKEFKQTGKPFFLAVGFFKPHLPLNSPKKYWDLYDESKLPISPNPDLPIDVTKLAIHGSNEVFKYTQKERGGAGKRISDDQARYLRHAYFAAVSYSDAQVGKVLDALDTLGLADNTIVVVWGDHGWHLGDQTMWGKHSTFERAVRSTLIVRTPGMPNPGVATDAVVESVDLYPTLLSLCHIDKPADLQLDGADITGVLNDPRAATDGVAYSFWKAGGNNAISVRNATHRLVRWSKPGKEDTPTAIELFDHVHDDNETTNTADADAAHVSEMNKLLERFDK